MMNFQMNVYSRWTGKTEEFISTVATAVYVVLQVTLRMLIKQTDFYTIW